MPVGKSSTYALGSTGGAATVASSGSVAAITPAGSISTSISGSVDNHSLTEGQLPAHFHYIANTDNGFPNDLQSNPSGTVTAKSNGGAGNNDYYLYQTANNSSNLAGKSSSIGSGTGHSHGSSGLSASSSFSGNSVTPSYTGSATSVVQPYVALNYIIRL